MYAAAWKNNVCFEGYERDNQPRFVKNNGGCKVTQHMGQRRHFEGYERGNQPRFVKNNGGCKETQHMGQSKHFEGYERGNQPQFVKNNGGCKESAWLKEREQLCKELSDLKQRLSTTEANFTNQYNLILDENEKVMKENSCIKNENGVLREENNVVKKDNAVLKKENAVLKEENNVVKKDNAVLKKENSALKQDIIALKKANENVGTIKNLDEVVSGRRERQDGGKWRRNIAPSSPCVQRVYDANNEEDVDYIFKCSAEGVGKCKLSNGYVNKQYTEIVRNNGYHNGVSNTCLALSLSDGLSRIVNGRPANSQEKDEMIKALGCKGRMMDISDLDVLVAIFNKVCSPHAINIHVFERLRNGYHAHHQSIAHSPNASTQDRCIVLSWIRGTHFELMVKPSGYRNRTAA
jgi:hypothetical protein